MSKFVILFVCFIITFNLTIASDKPLYFIKTDAYEYGRPDVTVYIDIYKYDEQQNKVTKVWPLNDSIEVHDVWMYESADIIIVSEGKYETDRLKILEINNPTHATTIDLENHGYVASYKYFYHPGSKGQIEVKFMGGTKNNYNYITKRYDIDSNTEITGDPSLIFGERRLAGLRRPNRGGSHDIARLAGKPSEALEVMGNEILFKATAIPEALIRRESTYGWNLVANEPGFYAILSIPDKPELISRELLIYNRITNYWKSYEIKGSETSPYLAGWPGGPPFMVGF